MMTFSSSTKLSAIAILAIVNIAFVNQITATEELTPKTNSTEKALYLPEKARRIPEKNDYNDVESEFCFKRMVQGDNIAIFWSKEYGDDPITNPEERKRFDVNKMLKECERFYDYYVNELKFVEKGKSLTDRYKLLVYVFGGEGGTAFGGGSDNKIGVLWTPAVRVNRAPYGVLAHEMVHCFQYLSRIDCGHGPRGAIMEMSAQYMLWQVYPEWMTFENYHLVDFMKQTHYAFLHPTNMYHSPYVLEYWSNKHGKEFFGDLCRATEPNEDPVMTYKRLNKLSQEEFNDEMFDACRRFITWDMKRIEKVAKPYANQHQCTLNDIGDGWYRIASSNCPQNYGYNGIKLKVPAAGTNVVLNFKGVVGAEGYNAIKTDKTGWRYGFLASLKDGIRLYGDALKESEGTATFKVPENTEFLWLVVMGAPTEHWPVATRRRGRGGSGGGDNTEEQWPYQFKLTGTTLDDSVIAGFAELHMKDSTITRRIPKDLSDVRGFNYTPANVEAPPRHHIDCWISYDEAVIEHDLDLAKRLNLNQVRVFVPYQVYIEDKEGLPKKLLHFVRSCHKRGIGVMPVVGYARQWTQDKSLHPQAREWAQFLVETLSDEPGLAFWDVMNEPDWPTTPRERVQRELDYARYMAGVFHELDPKTPVTIGMAFVEGMEELADHVDVLQFHDYMQTKEQIRANIDRAKQFAVRVGIPLINGEIGCVARANPYDITLQEHMDAGVGWYIWELMIVRRGWGEVHGVFYEDGTVRDPAIAAAVLGFFRNRGRNILPAVPDRERWVTRVVTNGNKWLKQPDASWKEGLDLAETAAHLLEAAELVPMRESPIREVDLMRQGQPDLPALRDLLREYIKILEPYRQPEQ